jgi:hypothetical protein
MIIQKGGLGAGMYFRGSVGEALDSIPSNQPVNQQINKWPAQRMSLERVKIVSFPFWKIILFDQPQDGAEIHGLFQQAHVSQVTSLPRTQGQQGPCPTS